MAVRKGIIPEERINESARKILAHKARYGILKGISKQTRFDLRSTQKAIDVLGKF